MRDPSGIEICQYIRKRPKLRYTYVVLIAASGEDDEHDASTKAGADDYVRNPSEGGHLRTTLRFVSTLLQQEDRLSSILQSWRLMLDALPFGIAALDGDGRLLRVNRPFIALLDNDPRALSAPTLDWDLVVQATPLVSLMPNTLQRSRLLQSIQRKESFDRREVEFRWKDAASQVYRIWGRPILGDHGVAFQIVLSR